MSDDNNDNIENKDDAKSEGDAEQLTIRVKDQVSLCRGRQRMHNAGEYANALLCQRQQYTASLML